jgi:hypothetical protein
MAIETHAPDHRTTIDQHRGDHEATGLPIYQLTDVITSFSDYSQERWERLSADDREWWEATLADIHAARVELAELPYEHRNATEEGLEGEGQCDVDNYAALIRRAISTSRPD